MELKMKVKPLPHVIIGVAMFIAVWTSRPSGGEVSLKGHSMPGSFESTHLALESRTNSALPGYWILETPVPVVRQNNAVIAYEDQLYVLGGYVSDGTAFRYDPLAKTWTQLATMSPVITHPYDGCLGYNTQGEAIIILFPDNWYDDTNSIMVYNIVHDAWSQRSMPYPMPSSGIWAPNIASDPTHNVCYITGGATYPGYGNLNTFYAYNPATNATQQLPSFTTSRNYHASWYVPQWGEAGYVCLAGGAEINIPYLDSTQCYDIAQGLWHAENADLGMLPRDITNPADALKIDGSPQLWIMGGLAGGNLWLTYYYTSDQGWVEGPRLAYAVSGAEGDVIFNDIYVVGGSYGGASKDYNQHFVAESPPPCQEVILFSDDFEGVSNWTGYGLWHTEAESNACGSLVAPFPSPDTTWYYGSQAYGCTFDAGHRTLGNLILNTAIPITGAQQITVTFQSYEDTECDDYHCSYDMRQLEVSFDQDNRWEDIWRGEGSTPWSQVVAPTRFYPGNTLHLRFHFDSLDYLNNDYLGWFIDNVEVTGCFEQPAQTWFEEDDPAIAYSGSWKSLACAECSGGTQKAAAQRGAAAEFTFTGTGIRWYLTKANLLGKARVVLDGVDLGFVDLYSPTPQYQQVWEKIDLSPGAHTLKIDVSGKKNPRSKWRAITLDALEVVP